MGIELIEKNSEGWERKWDKGKVDLSTPNLFTAAGTAVSVTVRARLQSSESVAAGDQLIARMSGRRIILSDGITEIATADDPPKAIVEALLHSPCCLATVRKLHRRSKSIDVLVGASE